MREIPNHLLIAEKIPFPHPKHFWNSPVILFAQFFDGYKYVSGNDEEHQGQKAALFLTDAFKKFESTKTLPTSLSALRALLFVEQRNDYWQGGSTPTDVQLEFLLALLGEIRRKVEAGELE